MGSVFCDKKLSRPIGCYLLSQDIKTSNVVYSVYSRMTGVWLGLSDGYSEASYRWTDTKSLSDWANWKDTPDSDPHIDCVEVTSNMEW